MRRLSLPLFITALTAFTAAAPADTMPETSWHILAADSSTHRIAVVKADGTILWQRKIGDIHDLHLLPNGNILFQDSMTHLLEVTPGTDGQPDKVVWEYDAGKMNGNEGKKVQVHSFQRLPDGSTMICESGIGRLIEVDRDGKIVHQFKFKLNHPSVHSDTRLARKLDNGHYLISHEADGAVREYDADGNVVWEYDVPMFGREPAGGHGPEAFGNHTFSALRLPTGNTLIATGNGHSLLEVTPEKKIVWSLTQDELPGIQLAWVTTIQLMPNGHIVFGNCHATEKNPQIVEIDKDKHVIWTYKDFKTFGNALSNSEILPEGSGPKG